MTHSEIVDVVRFLFPNKSILFQDEKVLQVEAKFTPTNENVNMQNIQNMIDVASSKIVQAICCVSKKNITVYDLMHGRAILTNSEKYAFVIFLPEYQAFLKNNFIKEAISIFMEKNDQDPWDTNYVLLRRICTEKKIDIHTFEKALIAYNLMLEFS